MRGQEVIQLDPVGVLRQRGADFLREITCVSKVLVTTMNWRMYYFSPFSVDVAMGPVLRRRLFRGGIRALTCIDRQSCGAVR